MAWAVRLSELSDTSHFAFIGTRPVSNESRQAAQTSTFDNGDSKSKPKNPLWYKDLAASIEVIS
jgi:hypothetical protein